MRKVELRAFLEAHHIPLDQWGTGDAKTFEHLYAEISSGESTLTETGGKLLRSAVAGLLSVYYHDGVSLWMLKELQQVFNDGRVRTRALEASLSEKMKQGEDPEAAAHRALSEELGITEKLPLILRPPWVKGPMPSPSFPGLYTLYTMHVFDVFLPPRWYCGDGYVERQADKSSYFGWEPAPALEARA